MARTSRTFTARSAVAVVGVIFLAVTLVGTVPSGAVPHRDHPEGSGAHAPGTLISSQAVTATGVDGTASLVEYWSESVPKNKPVKVTGLVIVPTGTAPAGGWPVVSWAHPTDGMVGNCAPSLDPTTAVPFMNDLLAQGWEVVASDYLNENALATTSKKLLPYVVGEEAARNAIDVVRAARQVPAADASTNYQVLGWSEGGHTALWVSNISAEYAPELTLEGSVAIAPAAEMVSLVTDAETNSTYWPLFLMLVAGYKSTYGGRAAPVNELLTSTGKKLVKTEIKTEPQCITGIIEGVAYHYTFGQAFSTSVVPTAWETLLNENDPANFAVAGAAPVLIVQGSADTLVPPSLTAELAGQLCSLDPPQPLERWIYTGLDHNSIIGTPVPGTGDPNGNGDSQYENSDSIGDIIQWMSDRFAGGSWPDPYVPTGTGNITVTQTNVC